jgi:hypothetical protein
MGPAAAFRCPKYAEDDGKDEHRQVEQELDDARLVVLTVPSLVQRTPCLQ